MSGISFRRNRLVGNDFPQLLNTGFVSVEQDRQNDNNCSRQQQKTELLHRKISSSFCFTYAEQHRCPETTFRFIGYCFTEMLAAMWSAPFNIKYFFMLGSFSFHALLVSIYCSTKCSIA